MEPRFYKIVSAVFLFIALPSLAQPQSPSVARRWSDMMLECIRKHQARPVVAARNLYHASILMYDGWAVYDNDASTVFLGKNLGGYTCPFNGTTLPANIQSAQEAAISYAMMQFLTERYQDAPNNNWNNILKPQCEALMADLGYDITFSSTNYSSGDPRALGNYLAQQLHLYSLSDGANQQANYANTQYSPVNGNIFPQLPGNPYVNDINRWQPLSLTLQLDQNGFPVPAGQPALGHDWGRVVPFALRNDQITVKQRDGFDWNVYLDQGHPPYLDLNTQTGFDDDFFKWGFMTVAIWHSFHDTSDGVMIDISPASLGNLDTSTLPETFEDYKAFYNVFEGGDYSTGYSVNPATGQPYEPQLVPRGDYSRVLSEYWADGPSSETPPGHWIKLLNEVSSHPLLEKKWNGQGPVLSDLEWDVRSYLALSAGLHDAAVACWSTKGYYDYTRPIMAIRAMADLGQSSDSGLPNYHPGGMPIIPGYAELVMPGDPLAGDNNEHLYKMKLYTWRGPATATGQTGVGWILAENWWTFQVATFVTPPFAGYYSGHSTYSRTAAELLARITGDEYFPGGMAEFTAVQNQYLLADTGPSQTIKLQWAKYTDAADQCGLSRIFGGLHPPQDDIPGRKVGKIVGPQVFEKATGIMEMGVPTVTSIFASHASVGGNHTGQIFYYEFDFSEPMNTAIEPTLTFTNGNPVGPVLAPVDMFWVSTTKYRIRYQVTDQNAVVSNTRVRVSNAFDLQGNRIRPALGQAITFDLQRPTVVSVVPASNVVNDSFAEAGQFYLDITYSEPMNPMQMPTIVFTLNNPVGSLTYTPAQNTWISPNVLRATFACTDINAVVSGISFIINGARDAFQNNQVISPQNNLFTVDTQNPQVLSYTASGFFLTDALTGTSPFEVTVNFSEAMNENVPAQIQFSEDMSASGLTLNEELSGWQGPSQYHAVFNLNDANAQHESVLVQSALAQDLAGNDQAILMLEELLHLDTRNPVVAGSAFPSLINDDLAASGQFSIQVEFDEEMDLAFEPQIGFEGGDPSGTLSLNPVLSGWDNGQIYTAVFDVVDADVDLSGLTVVVNGGVDAPGNLQETPHISSSSFIIDTRNPLSIAVVANMYQITPASSGTGALQVIAIFDEAMDQSVMPEISFPGTDPSSVLTLNEAQSGWVNGVTYSFVFDVSEPTELGSVDILVQHARDIHGNPMVPVSESGYFTISGVVGVEEFSGLLEGLELYPNPLIQGSALTLTMREIPEDLVIRIFDPSGKLVHMEQPTSAGQRLQLDTSNWSAGTWLLAVNGNGVRSTQRVVVMN